AEEASQLGAGEAIGTIVRAGVQSRGLVAELEAAPQHIRARRRPTEGMAIEQLESVAADGALRGPTARGARAKRGSEDPDALLHVPCGSLSTAGVLTVLGQRHVGDGV